MQCADVTLTEPEDVEEVSVDNCYNSSDIAFSLVFATDSLKSSASRTFFSPSTLGFVALASMVLYLL